jgi:FkbM family methyltransferase
MRALRRSVLAHRGWRYRTRVDPDEIRWMGSVLRPGDHAVDVGAYKGGYMYWMRHAVGIAGSVSAFEPPPSVAAYLRRSVLDFGWRNVHVEEVAASSETGVRTLCLPGSDPSPGASLVGASLPVGAKGYQVRTDTLDRLLEVRGPAGPVRLIKCDVEGHELDVFHGAARTLEKHRPFILFECEARHLRGHAMTDVFGHLEHLGYRGFFFWKGERCDSSAFDVGRHQVEGRRPYANNFVFIWGDAPPGQ